MKNGTHQKNSTHRKKVGSKLVSINYANWTKMYYYFEMSYTCNFKFEMSYAKYNFEAN